MKVYVTSRSGNHKFALEEGNVIAIEHGTFSLPAAGSHAFDHTQATDEPTWIYEVELRAVGAYKVKKQVTFVAAEQA